MMNKFKDLFKKFKKKTSFDEEDQFLDKEDQTGEFHVNSNSDDTGEYQVSSDTDDVYVQEEQSDEFTSSAIDIQNDELRFKDKLDLLYRKFKDQIETLNRKKVKRITLDKKESPKESDGNKLSITKSKFAFSKENLSKIKWDKLHKKFFAPENKIQINRAFIGIISLIVIYKTGSFIGTVLTDSLSDLGKSKYNLVLQQDRVLNRNATANIKNSKIFESKKQEIKKDQNTNNKAPSVCKDATKRSSLPIKLVNTIVLQDEVKSIASVQVRGNKISEVRQGDKINNMAEIGSVNRLKLIFKNLNNGLCEYVTSSKADKSGPSPINVLSPQQSKNFTQQKSKLDGIKNDGNNFTIEKKFLKEKLGDINKILTQAKGIPITNPDGSMSFRIVDIVPGGVFAYLGIENNDTITEINGEKIENLNAVMSLFGKISNMDQLSITVKRGGSTVPLDYKIK